MCDAPQFAALLTGGSGSGGAPPGNRSLFFFYNANGAFDRDTTAGFSEASPTALAGVGAHPRADLMVSHPNLLGIHC
jgi:hypothetical protein